MFICISILVYAVDYLISYPFQYCTEKGKPLVLVSNFLCIFPQYFVPANLKQVSGY